jgi:hypothetical protein
MKSTLLSLIASHTPAAAWPGIAKQSGVNSHQQNL